MLITLNFIGGGLCCTDSNKCDLGEGDCDSDFDCKGDFVCGTNNCIGSNFESNDDCCELSEGTVRLQNEKDPEVFWNGNWSPVCGHYFWNNNNGATLFCQKMGFSLGIVEGRGTNSHLISDAIRIGECEDNDSWLNCNGGCNDLKVGDHCQENINAKCGIGEPAKIEIQCSGVGKLETNIMTTEKILIFFCWK